VAMFVVHSKRMTFEPQMQKHGRYSLPIFVAGDFFLLYLTIYLIKK
jgi:hypothetical protein